MLGSLSFPERESEPNIPDFHVKVTYDLLSYERGEGEGRSEAPLPSPSPLS